MAGKVGAPLKDTSALWIKHEVVHFVDEELPDPRVPCFGGDVGHHDWPEGFDVAFTKGLVLRSGC